MGRIRGRPRLPPGKRRSERIWVDMTPAEADALILAALRAGASVSAFARRRLLQGLLSNEQNAVAPNALD